MRSIFVLALLAVVLATIAIVVRSGIAARKDPGKPINAAMRAALETPQFSTEDALIIAKKYPNARKTESGLLYIVHAPGEGRTPFKGQIVSFHYVGTFLNGQKFGSSHDHGAPFNFQIGMNRGIILGWEEAFASMRTGEKRTLIVPYWLGFGEKGRGNIPPRATLVYEVEILGIDGAVK